MKNAFFRALLATMFTVTFAATTGCAVDQVAEEEPAPAPADEAADGKSGTTSEALRIGGGSVGGSTGLWCACKLDCDNTYSGMPVLIKACKEKCDTDNQCRKSTSGSGSGGLFIY